MAASGVREEFIAGLLNRNLNSTDRNNLLDVVAEYFAERQESDSDDELDPTG